MDSSSDNSRGFYKWHYPSALQIVFVAAIWIFLIVFSVILQTKFKINSSLLTYTTLFYSLVAIVITIKVLRGSSGKEIRIITSVDNLKGLFTFEKRWALIFGFYSSILAFASVINGYYLIAVTCFIIFISVLIASKIIVGGIRVDDAGNIYYIKQSNEMLIDFSRAREIQFTGNYLTIYFIDCTGTELPSKLKIPVTKFRSVENSSHLNPQILGSFLKDKCLNLGLKITDIPAEYFDEWTASK